MSAGMKRGPNEVFGQGGAMSNGALMDAGQDFESNEAKKAKLETKGLGAPSRVIHIRNIPNEVNEAEVVHFGIPFGEVTNVMVLKGKNQAFLELSDEAAASTMVRYFNHCPAQICGQPVYVQFSNHKTLKTDQSRVSALLGNQGGQGGNFQQGLAGFQPSQSDFRPAQGLFNQSSQGLLNQSEFQGFQGGGPNTILRVIIEHMIYPVSLDVLHQIFSRAGNVMKIITFTKNNTFQALIQYPDVGSAQAAKNSLDGQNIYNGCCTLRIDSSKLTNLNVKFNNDKSRDFTNPNLPTGDSSMGGAGGGGGGPFSGMPLAGMHPPGGSDYGAAAGMHLNTPFHTPNNCVLLISNLNEEKVKPDALFTLFGVYGDVLRVKILYNKRSNALIQMAESTQAQLALSYLDKVKLWDQQVRVTLSKHQNVQMPKDEQSDAELTKDFSNSPLHRFKKPGSKNYQNICPPSATLHLSNIPESVDEDEIRETFENAGLPVAAFKFFQNNRKMALIQLESVEEAVLALIKMHNYKFGTSSYLRVSFSKNEI